MGKGKILQGDQLLEINGQNVRESNQKDVANQINQMDGELVLLLGNKKKKKNCFLLKQIKPKITCFSR